LSLAWTPDGTRLSGGDEHDPTIREWDPLTWQPQVGHPWEGHTRSINAIAIDPTGTLVASASHDNHVLFWRLSDRRNIGILEHFAWLNTVTFSVDGRRTLIGGFDYKISEWELPKDANLKASLHSSLSQHLIRACFVQILAITTAHDACVTGDLPAAEESLTQDKYSHQREQLYFISISPIRNGPTKQVGPRP
jgi:WD40 repeat protein